MSINYPHYNNHRIIDWFGVEGTFEDHLLQPPDIGRDIFN